MAVREAYVRVRVKLGNVEVIGGLEWRDGTDELPGLFIALRSALVMMVANFVDGDEMSIAKAAERYIQARWPDRAYFIETCSDSTPDCWIQLFQPYDIPRKR